MELYCNKCGRKIEVTSGICPYCQNESNTFYIDGGNIKDYHNFWNEINKNNELDLWYWLEEIMLCVYKYLNGNKSDESYIIEALGTIQQIEDYLKSLKNV